MPFYEWEEKVKLNQIILVDVFAGNLFQKGINDVQGPPGHIHLAPKIKPPPRSGINFRMIEAANKQRQAKPSKVKQSQVSIQLQINFNSI
jgi:hypothetical protein